MIKPLLKTINKGVLLPINFINKYRAKAALPQLTSHRSSAIRAIGSALSETLTNTMSPHEQALIGLIEQRRTDLLNSTEEITVVDYGAGSPNANRSKEEMKKGVQSTELIAKICGASKPAFWATFLFKLIRKLEPSSCLELGSCVGISASYQAAALHFNEKGALVTLEGSPEIAKIAKETLESLNFHSTSVIIGEFNETLSEALQASAPIDFFFNDGHHDHDAVIQYFNEALPYLSDQAIIIFDDISWSAGMRKAWHEIESDERVSVSIDFHSIGIVLIEKNSRL